MHVAPLRHALALALGLLLLLAGGDARAFCRTTTTSGDLPPNKTACAPGGTPLYWKSQCVGYSVQRDASRAVTLEEAEAAAAVAFSAWGGVDCEGAPPSVTAVDVGPVDCDAIGFNPDGANQNVIVFRDAAWPYPNGATTLAHTTVTFDEATGEILDADIEINTHDHRIVAVPTKPGDYDLGEVLTHEVGHFLGIAHTPDATATMYYRYNPSNRATLGPDDVAGACTIYPASGVRVVLTTDAGGPVVAGACDPSPRGGLGIACGAPAVDAGAPSGPTNVPSPPRATCDVGAPPTGGSTPFPALAPLFAAALAASRLATRARHRRPRRTHPYDRRRTS